MLDVEVLYRDHADHLYRALRRRFDRSVPDALIEDACAATWATSSGMRIQWVVATVGRHEVLALARKRRGEVRAEAIGEGADRSSLELAVEVREALELVAALGETQRVALSLQLAGYSYEELAEATGKTYTWANRHISEGRAASGTRFGDISGGLRAYSRPHTAAV